jgi:hypothetical protein
MIQAGNSPILYWIVILLTLPLLFVPGNATSSPLQTQKSPDSPDPINIGMVALLAAPQKYDGKLIRTVGFACLEFEGNALYLHEEDYRQRNTKNAVKLLLSKHQEEQFKSLSLRHVLIEGTVSADKWGLEKGMYSGSIGNITRLEYWRSRGDTSAPSQEPSPSR